LYVPPDTKTGHFGDVLPSQSLGLLLTNYNKQKANIHLLQNILQYKQSNRRYQTSPAVCNTPSRPIIDSSNTCNPVACTPLHGPVQFATIRGIRVVGHVFLQNCPFPFRDRHPHRTHRFSDQAHSSPQTAFRSVLLFLYGPQSLCCTMHRQWERKPKLPLPLGFRHPARAEPSHRKGQNAQKFLVKISRVVPDMSSWTDKHTDTQTCSSQYFAAAPVGKVINQKKPCLAASYDLRPGN